LQNHIINAFSFSRRVAFSYAFFPHEHELRFQRAAGEAEKVAAGIGIECLCVHTVFFFFAVIEKCR